MKMKFMGIVEAPPPDNGKRTENALFWSLDGKHQTSIPCDTKMKKLCQDLKPEQEVELDFDVK